MADTLIAGTTLVEKESRSIGDIPISGIIEWDDSIAGTPNIPEGFLECDGSTVTDALSPINGQVIPNLNTNYVTIDSAAFQTQSPEDDNRSILGGQIVANATITFMAPINIPNGAVVTAAIGYGSEADETWSLKRTTLTSGAVGTLASAVWGTEDTTISNATIDNSLYSYFVQSSSLDTTDVINGLRVTFTPRNKFIIRIR